MKAGAAGGIEAIAKAINTHISSAGVCESGCCTLRNVTCDNGKTLINTSNNKTNNVK